MGHNAAFPLHLQLLGQPRWATENGGGVLEGHFGLMLALVVDERRPSTDSVVRRIWAESASRGLLHTKLHRLRQKVEHRICEQDDHLELADGVEVDILGGPARWPIGTDPKQTEFLHGVESPVALRSWLEAQRAKWAKALAAADALRRAGELELAGAFNPALDLARRAVEDARWLPEAWLMKASLLYHLGESPEATRALEQALALGPLRSDADAQAADLRRALDRSLAAAPRRARLPASLIRPPVRIARESAWVAAEAAWAARRPFVLTGVAGVGKSRMLSDFLREHEGLLVETSYLGERAPYALLAEVLARVMRLSGLDPVADAPAALAGVMGAWSDERPEAAVDEIAIRNAARDLLVPAAAFVRAIGIDRFERADLPSMVALRTLADGPLRDLIHFGFASQALAPGPRRELLDAWVRAPDGARSIPLQPWTREQLAALLATLDLPRAAGRIAPSDLLERTDGVPQLVLFALRDLASSDGLATAAPHRPDPSELAATLQGWLREVPLSAQPLLQLSAVLDADPPLLAKALECSENDIAAMMMELVACGVMSEGRFVHDLMREAALESLAPAATRRWNALAAALLAPDRRVPRARVAAHWEAAERWPQAAAAYHMAGQRAEDVGDIQSARDLLLLAATCYARAGDACGEFDAVHDALTSELRLVGPVLARQLVDRLRALAATPEQRAKLAIADALLEVSLYRRGPHALAPATDALRAAEATGDPDLRATARSLFAAALAQAARHAEAIVEGRRAWTLARLVSTARKAHEVGTNLCYVFFESSQFTDAIALERELVADFERIGDRASVGATQGNLGMLLLLSGDPAASIGPLLQAHDRHRDVDGALGDLALMNRAGIAQALGFQGRFSEALQILFEDGRCLDRAAPLLQIRAKLQLVRAHLLLLLGDDEGAVAALDADDKDWQMAMKVQRCWALARAARMRGDDDAHFLQRMGELVHSEKDTPLAHAPWLEWSRQGRAIEVVERLREVEQAYSAAGMQGVARSARLRRIDRLAEIRQRWAIDEAAALASELRLELGSGLHATTYLPEAWLVLGKALHAAGAAGSEACLEEARRWVTEVALPNVPLDRREAFLNRNPVNRELFEGNRVDPESNGGADRRP